MKIYETIYLKYLTVKVLLPIPSISCVPMTSYIVYEVNGYAISLFAMLYTSVNSDYSTNSPLSQQQWSAIIYDNLSAYTRIERTELIIQKPQ